MTPDVTLRQLRYFVAVADERTMAAAAQRLRVTAAAVSLGIAALEKSFDCQLFIRTSHQPIALTEIGRNIAGDVRRLLDFCDEIDLGASTMQHGPHGSVSIGCFSTLAPLLVPQLVAEMADTHPAIRLNVREESQASLQQLLLDGRIELAIMYNLEIGRGLTLETLATTRPYVIVAGDHPLSGRKTIRLEELGSEPMLMLDIHPSKHYFSAILKTAGVMPVVERTSASFETIRSLVARNQGWSMLIQRPTIDLSYEGLDIAALAIEDDIPDMQIVLASVAHGTATRRSKVVVAACRRLLSSKLSPE